MAADELSLRYEGWRVAAASASGVFFASLLVYTFPIFLKPLSEEFSWSRAQVSFAYGITAATSALSAAPLGYLIDRVGPRRVAIWCLALFAVTFASLAWLTPHLWHLYAVFGVLGVVATGTSPVAYARAVSSWFARRRGMALAVAISGGSLGALGHPPVTQMLIGLVDWRTAYVVLGGLVLVAGLPIALRFVREHPSARRGPEQKAAGASVGQGLGSRAFWILIVFMFFSSAIQSSAIVHLYPLLTDRGVPASQAAIALSVFGGASIVSRLGTGWLIDRFFAPRVAFALLVIASLGALALSGAHTFAIGALAAALIGFGTEGDVAPYLLSRYFGLRSFSLLYGLGWAATATAAAIGPILMGRAFDATRSYEVLLVRLAVVALAVAALMLVMPRYDRRDTPARIVHPATSAD
jgi:predicted MFS family arabinose efflux permease